MAVYTETIQLTDKVSAPAISAAQKMKTLSSAVTSAQNALVLAEAKGDMKGIRKATDNLTQMQTALKGADHEATASQGSFGGLQAELAEMTGGLSIAIEIIGAFAAGLGILAVAGAKMAIEASTAKAQMLTMFDALGAGVTTGAQVNDMLNSMRDKIGVTKDSMVPLVKEFMAMGVTGKEAVEKLTTAALSAKALMGGADSAAQAFTSLTKKIQLAAETGHGLKLPLKGLGSLAEMGITVDEVAKKMGVSASDLSNQLKNGTVNATKFGDALNNALIEKGKGPLEKMGMSLGNLGSMLKEYIGNMFEDMQGPVYDFLGAVKDAFGVFSQAKPSGQAMKTGIQSVITKILEYATKLIPIMKHFFLDMIIFGLKAYIAIKPIIKWVKDFIASATGMAILSALWDGLKTALMLVGGAIALVVGLFVVMTGIGVAVGAGIWALAAIISTFVSDTIAALIGWVPAAWDAATDFVKGLVDGITNGAGLVIDAVKNLGKSAIGAFKGVLGISSPSKIMVEHGENTGEGVAQGISNKTKDVADASGDLGGAASGGFSSSGGGDKSSSKSVQVTFGPGSIQISGAGKSAEAITEEMISLTFERIALAGGL